DIEIAVADEVRVGEIDPQLLPGANQHAGTWLSAIASRVRMMRTKVHRVQPGIVAGKLGPKRVVDLMNQRLGEVAPPDAGLVGNQDGFHPAVIDFPDGRTRPRERFVETEVANVADFLRYRSVPV